LGLYQHAKTEVNLALLRIPPDKSQLIDEQFLESNMTLRMFAVFDFAALYFLQANG
jgi:hypothetical protein